LARLRQVGDPFRHAFFRHPLVLLTLGALISSLLVPWFTRKWQDHQKALELKSALAGQIAESATSTLIGALAVHDAHRHHYSAAERNGWREWQIKSAAIEARVRAYFPNNTLADEWVGFTQEAEAFHYISNGLDDRSDLWCLHGSLLATSHAARRVELEAMREVPPMKIPRPFSCVQILPINRGVRTRAYVFEYEYQLVDDQLMARRTELIKRILSADMKAF
jgi:hypothetical protein